MWLYTLTDLHTTHQVASFRHSLNLGRSLVRCRCLLAGAALQKKMPRPGMNRIRPWDSEQTECSKDRQVSVECSTSAASGECQDDKVGDPTTPVGSHPHHAGSSWLFYRC